MVGSNNKLNNALATIRALASYKHADYFSSLKIKTAEEVEAEKEAANTKAEEAKEVKEVKEVKEEKKAPAKKPAAKKVAAEKKPAAEKWNQPTQLIRNSSAYQH